VSPDWLFVTSNGRRNCDAILGRDFDSPVIKNRTIQPVSDFAALTGAYDLFDPPFKRANLGKWKEQSRSGDRPVIFWLFFARSAIDGDM
jgi:hypothetical protein